MKTKLLQKGMLLLVVIISSPGVGQQKKINIQIIGSDNQSTYAANQIKKAASENKYTVTISSNLNQAAREEMVVRIVSYSATAIKVASDNGLNAPQNLGWQAYAIRVKNNSKQKSIYILAADKTGAMYGSFDVAEAIRLQTINTINNSDNKPYLDRRGN